MRKIVAIVLLCALVGMTFSGCGSKFSKKELDAYGFTKAEEYEGEEKRLAFPGADGWGKYTVGGRGGKVIAVTNLNDSGEGSLRAAIEAKGPRTIVFQVSGTIELEDFLIIKEPYVTIAGQTAPGDGICLKNYGLIVETDEVIVRYIRCRPGDDGGETDALWVNEAKQVIIDHVSTSWGTDETLSVSDSDKVSVQWCMITESLNRSIHAKGDHGMGSLVRGSNGQQVTYHSNYYFTHRNRSPMCGNYTDISEDPVGFYFEFINNVAYNWSGEAAGKCHDVNTLTHYNFMNNYYISGPISHGEMMFSEGCGVNKMYAAGNSMNGVVPKDPWSLIQIEEDIQDFDWDEYKQAKPFPSIMTGMQPAKEAYEAVIEEAGASLHRDHVDEAVIETMLEGKGKIINKPEESVGWEGDYPVLEQASPYEDEDKDGMDDQWEEAHGLDPNNGEDGKEACAYGYTYLEVFLQSLLMEAVAES